MAAAADEEKKSREHKHEFSLPLSLMFADVNPLPASVRRERPKKEKPKVRRRGKISKEKREKYHLNHQERRRWMRHTGYYMTGLSHLYMNRRVSKQAILKKFERYRSTGVTGIT